MSTRPLTALIAIGCVCFWIGRARADQAAPATSPADHVVSAAVQAGLPSAAPTATAATSDEAAKATTADATNTAPESIMIDYSEADIQSVLRTLAAKAEMNLIMGDEVVGKVTVHLENVSYEDAMRLIVESKGFAFVKDKNVVRVKSRESLEVEPVEVRVHTLNYAKAEDIKKTLLSMLSKQGKVEIDVRSNTLLISDTPSSLAKLMPLVDTLDTQTPQVMIEAKFVETTKNPQKDLGINWKNTVLNHPVSFGGPPAPGATAQTPGDFQFSKNLRNPAGSWIPTSALLDAGQANAVLSFLNQDTDTELLANPRIVTTDNQKASIAIAEQYPIPQFAFSEQTGTFQISGFEYKDIGIILNVVPRINQNEYVTLEVTPEASSSTENATLNSGTGNSVQIPIIQTRTATTTVLIKSGNTLAIGGLMRVDVSDTYTKVPLMGDLPGLGPLFRSKSLSKTKRDLLIFLTPTIVGPDSRTGYEKYAGGFPDRPAYTDDKWMPRDNAKARSLFKAQPAERDYTPDTNAPAQNFGPK